jgi:hypothetical protein
MSKLKKEFKIENTDDYMQIEDDVDDFVGKL